MNTKVQTTLIILVTFCIGVLAGALVTGKVREKRVGRLQEMGLQDRFHRQMERIIQPTAEQKAAIESALSTRSEQISLLHDKYQAEIYALYDSLQSDFSAILTDEQRARLQEEMQRGPRRFTRDRIQQLTHELDLTPGQQEKIAAIMTAMMPGPQDFRNRKERDPRNRQERWQSFQKRFQKMEEELLAVLTPEQRDRYQTLREQRGMMFGRPGPGMGPGPDFRNRGRNRDNPPPPPAPFQP